jgi:hypothetical protein
VGVFSQILFRPKNKFPFEGGRSNKAFLHVGDTPPCNLQQFMYL